MKKMQDIMHKKFLLTTDLIYICSLDEKIKQKNKMQ
jgi:hypothetical protein